MATARLTKAFASIAFAADACAPFGGIAWAQPTAKVDGYVEVSYSYNLNRPNSGITNLRGFDNGVLLMRGAALAALVYTRGNVSKLVVTYSINVFLTFLLSNVAMTVFWIRQRKQERSWARHLPAHVVAVLLCGTILGVTVFEKFSDGGWLTLLITSLLCAVCFLVRRHYGLVVRAIKQLDRELPGPEEGPEAARLYGEAKPPADGEPDPRKPVALLAVEAEQLAAGLFKQYPRSLAVAGQLIFEEDTLWNRVLHNETAFLIQRRLQHAGVPMVVLPVQLDLRAARAILPPAVGPRCPSAAR